MAEDVRNKSGAPSFTLDATFPVIKRLVEEGTQSGAWVEQAALLDDFSADPEGRALVASAVASGKWASSKAAATNILAWFHAKYTRDTSRRGAELRRLFARVGTSKTGFRYGLLGGGPVGVATITRGDEGEAALGVDDYAEALARVMDTSIRDFFFAILGPWGRGKTFLLRRLVELLPSFRSSGVTTRDHIPVWFSAWKYPRTPELWVHLYETLASEARAAPMARFPELFGPTFRGLDSGRFPGL